MCEAVEEIRECSSGQSAYDADSYLKRLMTFEFLASAVMCHHVLAYTRPLTVALQAKECDLLRAHTMAQHLVKALENERSEDKFHTLWSKIERIASTMNMEPAKKRTVSRQTQRTNPPVKDIEAHYKVAYFYAFLDHAISHLKTRFPADLHNALLATYFVPARVNLLTDEVVQKLKSEFYQVLPHPSELEKEVSTWKVHMEQDSSEGLLYTCSVAEKHRTYYPNIHAMLMLLLSLPVGTCSCERSFSLVSSPRRLKTWCRSTMGNERLDALAMGYINCERMPCPKEILKVWDSSGSRRVAIAFNE